MFDAKKIGVEFLVTADMLRQIGFSQRGKKGDGIVFE